MSRYLCRFLLPHIKGFFKGVHFSIKGDSYLYGSMDMLSFELTLSLFFVFVLDKIFFAERKTFL